MPLPRKRSPDGASPDWGCGHLILIAAYYSWLSNLCKHIFMRLSFVRLTRFLARLLARPRVTLLTSDTLSKVIYCIYPRKTNKLGRGKPRQIFVWYFRIFSSDGFPYFVAPAFFTPAFSAPPPCRSVQKSNFPPFRLYCRSYSTYSYFLALHNAFVFKCQKQTWTVSVVNFFSRKPTSIMLCCCLGTSSCHELTLTP